MIPPRLPVTTRGHGGVSGSGGDVEIEGLRRGRAAREETVTAVLLRLTVLPVSVGASTRHAGSSNSKRGRVDRVIGAAQIDSIPENSAALSPPPTYVVRFVLFAPPAFKPMLAAWRLISVSSP